MRSIRKEVAKERGGDGEGDGEEEGGGGKEEGERGSGRRREGKEEGEGERETVRMIQNDIPEKF